MRKKIIAISVVIVFLATFYVHSVAAAYTLISGITITAWTDKPQYAPGEKGKLKISILNSLDKPVDINEINITYPWLTYNAKKSKWEGNETITGEPVATIASKRGDYYVEVDFTVPNDGRVTGLSSVGWSEIKIDVDTSEGKVNDLPVNILVMSSTLNISVADMGNWMTILTVAIVISTIILAAVIFLFTRRPTIATVATRAKA